MRFLTMCGSPCFSPPFCCLVRMEDFGNHPVEPPEPLVPEWPRGGGSDTNLLPHPALLSKQEINLSVFEPLHILELVCYQSCLTLVQDKKYFMVYWLNKWIHLSKERGSRRDDLHAVFAAIFHISKAVGCIVYLGNNLLRRYLLSKV